MTLADVKETQGAKEIKMINQEYKEWLVENWTQNGGLLTQVQASRLLGKTPTRIRQMINEGKLRKINFKNESPALSFVQVMEIYKTEENEIINMYYDKKEPTDDEIRIIEAKEEKEYQDYLDRCSKEELEEIEIKKQVQVNAQKKLSKIQEKIEKLQEQEAELRNILQ